MLKTPKISTFFPWLYTHTEVHTQKYRQTHTCSSNRNGIAEIKLGKELKNKASTVTFDSWLLSESAHVDVLATRCN